MENSKLIDNDTLAQKLEESPAPRVTKREIESRIATVSYHRITETVTICQITLDNGFTSLGESACVNPENYNKEIGERIAFDMAFGKLWSPFGFLLAEKQFQESQQRTDTETPADEAEAA